MTDRARQGAFLSHRLVPIVIADWLRRDSRVRGEAEEVGGLVLDTAVVHEAA